MKKITLLLIFACIFSFSFLFAQNVGIGTITPQNPLHIHHSTSPLNRFTNTTTGTTSNDGSYIGVIGRHMYLVNEESAGDQYFYTDNSLRMTIDSIGRVGIGKFPEDKFDVKGDMRIESSNNSTGSLFRMYGGATGSSNIYFYKDIANPVLGATIGYNPSSDYAYISNGTGAYFTPTGVGINNASPLSKFHILGGQDVGLAADHNGFIMLGPSNSTNLIADNNEILARNNGAAADLFLQHDAGNLIICGNEAGAVGIGVASGASIPTGYLLAVDGKIISEELKVQLSGSWPDYVFKQDYPLKSFDHLRSFIKTNKHLPNIPPAAEVEKNGIEVGDMQKRMMEKIEELTLYILELEQRVKSLENANSAKSNLK